MSNPFKVGDRICYDPTSERNISSPLQPSAEVQIVDGRICTVISVTSSHVMFTFKTNQGTIVTRDLYYTRFKPYKKRTLTRKVM